MKVLWSGLEPFGGEEDYRAWTALMLAEQQEMVKAKAIAAQAAFDDLPSQEQQVYISMALSALKGKEFAS